MRRLAVCISLVTVLGSVFAETLTGARVVSSNETISEKVTGSGYFVVDSGATLTLSNPENDFTGGVIVSNGVVQADEEGALGSGVIKFQGADAQRQVVFNKSGATFANNYEIYDRAAPSSYPALLANESVTLTGDFTGGQSLFIQAAANKTLTCEGDINLGTAQLYNASYGKVIMKGKITCELLQQGYASGHTGDMELWNPGNSIVRIYLKMGSLECMATNVCYGARVQWSVNSWYLGGTSSQFRLNGYDQEIACLHDDVADANYGRIGGKAFAVVTPDDKPATVTVIGTSGDYWASTCSRVHGPVTVVLNKKDGMSMAIARWKKSPSLMTGALIATNSTMYVNNGATFTNATALVAAAAGTFNFGMATNVFLNLKTIEVAGTILCNAGCVSPINSPQSTLNLASTGKLYFENDVTNTVKYLMVDGVLKPAGVYTKDNLPQMKHATSESKYTGVLEVQRGRSGITITVR